MTTRHFKYMEAHIIFLFDSTTPDLGDILGNNTESTASQTLHLNIYNPKVFRRKGKRRNGNYV